MADGQAALDIFAGQIQAALYQEIMSGREGTTIVIQTPLLDPIHPFPTLSHPITPLPPALPCPSTDLPLQLEQAFDWHQQSCAGLSTSVTSLHAAGMSLTAGVCPAVVRPDRIAPLL